MLRPEREGMISQYFILIEKNTPFQGLLRPTNDATASGWVHVANDDIHLEHLEKELFAAGWMFFYTAWAISAFGFGFEKPTGFGN